MEDRALLESELMAQHERGKMSATATRLLDGYGPEIISYLMAVIRDESAASDAFGIFSEDVWKALPRFRRESSFRTWVYRIARSSAARVLRDPHRRAERAVPLSRAPEIFQVAEGVRTTTLMYLRSEVKDRFSRLREQLEEADQTLFILRINRHMSWSDIARIMAEEGESSESDLKKRATKLRKRFQRAKEKLRELAREDGLLGNGVD